MPTFSPNESVSADDTEAICDTAQGDFGMTSRRLVAAAVSSVRLLLLTCSHPGTRHGRNRWAEDLVSQVVGVGRIAIDRDQHGHPVSKGDGTSPRPDEDSRCR